MTPSMDSENSPSASQAESAAALRSLLGRRSISPRRLGHPGPDIREMERMIEAALRAPDHGRLHPWRVIEFPVVARPALASLFEREKRRRNPLADARELEIAREQALGPPVLLGFVVCIRPRTIVHAREQWLCAGAALGNLLNAAHALGYGAIVLSGDRCFDEPVLRALNVAPGEELVGFVSIGSIGRDAPVRDNVSPSRVWTAWSARAELSSSAPK